MRAVRAGTFHTFAAGLLREWPRAATGLDAFAIAGAPQQLAVLRDVLARSSALDDDAAAGGADAVSERRAAAAAAARGGGGGGGTAWVTEEEARVVLRRIAQWKEEGLAPDDVRAGLSGDAPPLADAALEARVRAHVYGAYQRALRAASLLDFGDLVLCATSLLRTHRPVLDLVRSRVRHVLVDEFQVFGA